MGGEAGLLMFVRRSSSYHLRPGANTNALAEEKTYDSAKLYTDICSHDTYSIGVLSYFSILTSALYAYSYHREACTNSLAKRGDV